MRCIAILLAVTLASASCGGGRSLSDGTATATGSPAFLTVPLTDVRTGERFTLGSFDGKVTFFIAMAVW